MSNHSAPPFETTIEVRDACLCLHVQRAARSLARRFGRALAPFGLTHGQFSLMMSLNRPEPPSVGAVADLLGMDRTTVTADLKPLKRRGLVMVHSDHRDKRARRLVLTPQGRELLAKALVNWRATHDGLEARLPGGGDRLRADLNRLARVEIDESQSRSGKRSAPRPPPSLSGGRTSG